MMNLDKPSKSKAKKSHSFRNLLKYPTKLSPLPIVSWNNKIAIFSTFNKHLTANHLFWLPRAQISMGIIFILNNYQGVYMP